jgi:hypothetical protein
MEKYIPNANSDITITKLLIDPISKPPENKFLRMLFYILSFVSPFRFTANASITATVIIVWYVAGMNPITNTPTTNANIDGIVSPS